MSLTGVEAIGHKKAHSAEDIEKKRAEFTSGNVTAPKTAYAGPDIGNILNGSHNPQSQNAGFCG